jgi:hypothetical protein
MSVLEGEVTSAIWITQTKSEDGAICIGVEQLFRFRLYLKSARANTKER